MVSFSPVRLLASSLAALQRRGRIPPREDDENGKSEVVGERWEKEDEAGTPKLYLVTYGSYNHLPSFDPDCLTAICLLRFCRLEFVLEPSNEPSMSPTGSLPFLMLENGGTVNGGDLTSFCQLCKDSSLQVALVRWQSKERQINSGMGMDRAINSAAIALLLHSIKPAILAALWLEEPVYDEITKPNYSRHYPWPIGEFLMWRRRSQMRARLFAGGQTILTLKRDALDALQMLSELLASREYFGGEIPDYADALTYGLLAVAISFLDSSHELRKQIEACANLGRLISRMQGMWMERP